MKLDFSLHTVADALQGLDESLRRDSRELENSGATTPQYGSRARTSSVPGGYLTGRVSETGMANGNGCPAHVISQVTATQVDRNASVGLTDPTGLRRTLATNFATAETAAFNRVHNHPGFHPYRVVLGDVSPMHA